jgi:hypothetical protein
MPNEIHEPKVRLIPAAVRPLKKVAIYCRVSTMHDPGRKPGYNITKLTTSLLMKDK